MEAEDFAKLQINIAKKVIKKINKTFKVTDKNGDSLTDKDIFSMLITPKKTCIGTVTKCGQTVQCGRKIVENEDYCSVHLKKKVELASEAKFIQVDYIYENTDNNVDITGLQKKFIEDTFYYIDINNNTIYTKDGNKAGIVNDKEYVLTNNPYIFN